LKNTNQKSSVKRIVAKYFIHGILFSMLFLVFQILWGSIAVFLAGSDLILGLLIGFWLLVPIVGFANSVITSLLWFKVEISFLGTMAHGFVLLIILFIVNVIVILVPYLVFPGTVTSVVTLIIASFPDGLVGKTVAEWWR